MVKKFFEDIVEFARAKKLLSHKRFTVDGTSIDSLTSLKSLQSEEAKNRKPPSDDDPGNPTRAFHGEKGRNGTASASGSTRRTEIPREKRRDEAA